MLPSEATSKMPSILKISQYRYLQHFSDFHPLLLQRVKTFIDNTKRIVGNKLGFDKPITVCVHIRRGDLLWQKYKDRGFKFAPLPAFKFTMKTMKKKFKQVIFIVASEEQNWYRKQFH